MGHGRGQSTSPLDCSPWMTRATVLLLDTVGARHQTSGGNRHGIGSASELAHRARRQYEGSLLFYSPLPRGARERWTFHPTATATHGARGRWGEGEEEGRERDHILRGEIIIQQEDVRRDAKTEGDAMAQS